MNYKRQIESNPNTKKIAFWYELTEQEFNKIKGESIISVFPRETEIDKTYFAKHFSLHHNTDLGVYFIAYYAHKDPAHLIQNIIRRYAEYEVQSDFKTGYFTFSKGDVLIFERESDLNKGGAFFFRLIDGKYEAEGAVYLSAAEQKEYLKRTNPNE